MARLGVVVAVGLLSIAWARGAQADPLGRHWQNSGEKQNIIQQLMWHGQLVAQSSVQSGRRSALVIGNGAYDEERLANAVNDAEEVARTLREIGFAVQLVRNGDKRTINEAVEAFSRRLGQGDIGLFYYSGHGVQVNGENYLVPINAKLSLQTDAEYDAVPLGKVVKAVESSSATAKIIILDACRNNPFYRRWRSPTRGSATRGLATPETSGSDGIFIAFSTAPGKVAADRIGNGRNSPFTTQLLRHLRTPNLEVGQLFRLVRADVVQATHNQQIPWDSNSLVGNVFLNPQSSPPATALESQPSGLRRRIQSESLGPEQSSEKLIQEWRLLNGACRGGSGDKSETWYACGRRDTLAQSLYAMGYCFGKKNEYGYQYSWHKCQADSEHPEFLIEIPGRNTLTPGIKGK